MCKLYHKVSELQGQALTSKQLGEPTPQWIPWVGKSVLPTSMYCRSDPSLISIAASLLADKYEFEQRNTVKGETWDGLQPTLLCRHALAALPVRQLDRTEPGLPETQGNITHFSNAQVSHAM